jgi:hypothetical protein
LESLPAGIPTTCIKIKKPICIMAQPINQPYRTPPTSIRLFPILRTPLGRPSPGPLFFSLVVKGGGASAGAGGGTLATSGGSPRRLASGRLDAETRACGRTHLGSLLAPARSAPTPRILAPPSLCGRRRSLHGTPTPQTQRHVVACRPSGMLPPPPLVALSAPVGTSA